MMKAWTPYYKIKRGQAEPILRLALVFSFYFYFFLYFFDFRRSSIASFKIFKACTRA